MGAVLDYVQLTQLGRAPRLQPPRRMEAGGILQIDPATRRNLEVFETLAGERRGSLLAAVDRTLTGAGARQLAADLAAPLTDPLAIGRRLDMVQALFAGPDLRRDIRAALAAAPDVERAMQRLALGRGGPRDLAALRDGLPASRRCRRGCSPAGRVWAATGNWSTGWRRRWRRSCRCSPATAASSPRATTPISTPCARCATPAAG